MILLDSTVPKPGAALPTDGESDQVIGRFAALLPAVAHLGTARLLANPPIRAFPRACGTRRVRSPPPLAA